jgi:glucokinase
MAPGGLRPYTSGVRAIIGVDIGSSKTLYCLFDERFRVLKEKKVPTEAESPREFDEALRGNVRRLARFAHREGYALACTGVGVAGPLERRKGALRWHPVSLPLDGYRLEERVASVTGPAVLVGNDAHLGLYGEHKLGAARGRKHVLGCFFGTGAAGGLILDGRLHTGTSGRCGDIGHYMISPIGPLAGSERQGVLDDVVGRSAMAGAAAAYAAKRWAPALYRIAGTDAAKIRSGALAKAIKGGDAIIENMVRSRARIAGIALSNLADFLDPEMLVIGGGLVDAMPKLFLREVREAVRRHGVPEVSDRLKVRLAELGPRVVAAGAAKAAWDRFIAEDAVPDPD